MPSIPDELKNGINATNFFLSLLLVIFGVTSLIISIFHWDDGLIVKLNLFLM
jgi:hypothetical protein